MKRLLPFFVFLFLLNSCDSEFKPVVFETTEINNTYEADISVIYDKAIGKNELSKTINFKIEEAIITTLSDATKKTNLESILKDFNSEFINFKKDFPDASEPVWELHIETEKIYQSDEVITLAVSTYEFKGGAHGNDKIKFLNLNAKTGEVLNQKDIIENLKDFKVIAKSHFVKSLDRDSEQIKMEDFFFGKPFQLPENIGFSDDGLVLLYNVYEVASYDQGFTEFVIPFNDVESLLKVH
ncbi:DUF3298 and DUF4163 domain-containing protein [Winogradskyella sp.]|uniref:DUF3298 and DUF4163 domain-containing protein n=1 Tax=unclassified Winogradskyella TaxID=2615021 RepID=UPI001B2EFB9E|nr:DUF3298 and DUF4163 domain-containing protein [Winogradskyella sp.]MBO6879989.1 DUF4163 domain-containing protein [Winogradskyella sp.]